MRTIIAIIFTALVGISATAQTEHEWHVTLTVVDEHGMPIPRANVTVGYYTNSIGTSIDGLTDSNGVFTASHDSYGGDLGFFAKKGGFYSTRISYKVPFDYDSARWNPNQTITLRQIGHPIPMYAKRQEIRFPELDKPIGFDLMAGDWISPYGKGFHTDVSFEAHREIKNDREFDADLTIKFPRPGDGITIAPSELVSGSEFKTSRTALNNGYQSELKLHFSNAARPQPVFGYFFRVRTELGQNGEIESTLYGKVAGNFRFYAGTIAPTAGMGFDYYLNRIPNDRNLEFDPKRNLVQDMKPLEVIRDP